jgi:hypothetical protein
MLQPGLDLPRMGPSSELSSPGGKFDPALSM